jgi:hypothetical protein
MPLRTLFITRTSLAVDDDTFVVSVFFSEAKETTLLALRIHDEPGTAPGAV